MAQAQSLGGTTARLYAHVPVMNLLPTSRGLHHNLMEGDWGFAGFDLMMLVLAAGFAARTSRLIRSG